MNASLFAAAKVLPLAERVELVEALWETIVAEGFEPSLSPAQAQELDARLQAHRENPSDVVSWEEIKGKHRTS
jgi:putative addiction module component (TIGR02574 family)